MLNLVPADALLHVGNVLFLLAYMVRDILWLRLLTVIATLCLMPYYCVQQTPLYAPIFWCSLFTMVNIVQIALLILERRPVFLGEEELQLYRSMFRCMRPREFTKLLSIAEWRRAAAGEQLLRQGEPAPELMLIASGGGSVIIDGREVAELTDGQFVGEMGFLTNREASATVVVRAATNYLAWPVTALRDLLNESPTLHQKLLGVLGSDLAEKLRREGPTSAPSARPPSGLAKSLRARMRRR